MTNAERQAAAERAAAARAAAGAQVAAPQGGELAPFPPGPCILCPPDYFGIIPNYATSPSMRKFIDSLPGVGLPNANNLGQYIPLAVKDTTTYPGSDYYRIGLVDYFQPMHSDLITGVNGGAGTKLRGYKDLSPSADGSAHYLGPVILAKRDVPVRIKFSNLLGTGAAGNLFVPVDTTLMGAGLGPDGVHSYTQNRAAVHLHGGNTPWISDGTPHQWMTPAGESSTTYLKGDSFQNVPDMPDPGNGNQTIYYTNQQSSRLMFYHEHALGITRLAVYAGVAAGYLLWDQVEEDFISGTNVSGKNLGLKKIFPDLGGVYHYGIPLVIQDKTFVPDTAQLIAQDPTWDTTHWGGKGNLWLPHVYMPNQNPWDMSGANAMGRWDYALWFWPPYNGLLTHGAIPNIYYQPNPLAANYEPQTEVPGMPNPTIVPEAFMDTPVINGTAYPFMQVARKAYRLRILNASNDRFWHLSLFYAVNPTTYIPAAYNPVTHQIAPAIGVCQGAGNGTTCTDVGMVPAVQHKLTPPATDPIAQTSLPLCAVDTALGPGFLALATLSAGLPINNTGLPANCWPTTWPTDGRNGGVPDPMTAGPPIIQIGTEGGFMPAPVVIPATPVGFNYNRRDIVVLNVENKSLFLGPAERADVIVDFSQVPDGSTLILYNDAPAPVPAFDTRYDFYTGDPDQTSTGGAPTTVAGYGPNTRTIMQFRVVGATADPAYNLLPLQDTAAGLPAVFAASQDPPVVPQTAYTTADGGPYSATITDVPGQNLSAIQSTSLTFTPIGETSSIPILMKSKAIQELFETNYGRMNATLGVELPFTNANNQTTIPLGYIDPATEILLSGASQIWKITHNGVDTHAIHFHLVNVQLINRVGWDGAIRPPDPNELGWKETVRMNPLEDAIVTFKSVLPTVPFTVPLSSRLLDPTQAPGSTMNFWPQDANGNPVTTVNQVENYGWEYVWHCHLLGHEENDMMRSIIARKRTTPDFSADGLADVLWFNPDTGDVNIWFMNGTTISSQGSPGSVGVSSPWQIAGHGDFNGDGNEDILWRNSTTGDVAIWLMDGASLIGFGSPGSVGAASPWQIAGVGDFNGDGKADILWRNTTTGDVSIWLMNGGAIKGFGSLGSVPAAWQIFGVGDFDGDGKSDILWRNTTTGDVSIWFMNGGAISSFGSLGSVSTAWQIFGVGDFNGDGKADILWRNTTTGDVSIWLMNGATLIGGGSLGSVPTAWQIFGAGDFNGDGKSDILWRNTTTGDVSIWLMNGLTISGGGSLGSGATTWQIKN